MSAVTQYLSFTGANSCYALLPLSVLAGATTFTIEVKFSTTSTASYSNNYQWKTIIGREIGNYWQDDFGLCVNGGKLCFWAEPITGGSSSTKNTTTNIAVNSGAIHKVAVVSSGGAIDLYCDGVLIAHTDNVDAKITDTYQIGIASNIGNSSSLLQMDFYEARLWSVARTQEQIFADIQGNETGLEAWYIPSADGLQDYSGNSRHATLYGSPAYIEVDELPLELNFDVKRKVHNSATFFRYLNAGTAETLLTTGTTLTNLPESKSKTGMAFYQEHDEKCFDIPAASEVWIKFDMYHYSGTSRFWAGSIDNDRFTGVMSWQTTEVDFWERDELLSEFLDVMQGNTLQTWLLHMKSGVADGLLELWCDGSKVGEHAGNVNNGDDFAGIFLCTANSKNIFSNVVISNEEITFSDGYHSISFDVERKITASSLEVLFDVERNLIEPIIVPAIGEHFNHVINMGIDVYRGGAQKIILPKKSKACIHAVDYFFPIRVFSDTDPVGKTAGTSYIEFSDLYAELDECTTVFIEISPLFTAQQIIRAFMDNLINFSTQAYGLDLAINACTGRTIPGLDTLTSNFLRDLNSSANYADFLSDYCDIILDNADTGAITGKDASGGLEKTAQSVVRERTPIEQWEMPEAGTSTVINALTVRWPTSGVNGDFSDAEKFILKGLNSEWIARSLELIYDTYEISFYDYRIAVREISVNFENNNNDVLAYVNYKQDSSGNCTELSLLINMRFYSAINQSSEDGSASTTGEFYLDRTLAHELTHGIMAALLNSLMNNLPKYILEGTAELVHGIDDARHNIIVQLLTTRTADLESVFSTGSSDSTDHYAAGYMLLRYLAKQGRYSIDSRYGRYGSYVNSCRIDYLLISDGATLYDGMTYEALTDNTRQILSADISRRVVISLEYDYDIFISNVFTVELFADIKRALLAQVILFARDSDDFFNDPDNPFVVRESNSLLRKTRQLRAANLPSNTRGLQNFEIALAEQQLTDQVRFSAVIPFDIMQQVSGQYLDYRYNMRVERVQQQGILYTCDCCSDVDNLLYTQMSYTLPKNTFWRKIDGEEVGGTPKTVEIKTVYPAASTHVNKIASALHLSPVMQFDDFLSTVLMDEQGGVTYNDLIRDIFGWSSRVPTMLINVFIRDGKLFVIQRGHESHTINISNAQMTMPVITKEIVRTTWGSTLWSKTTTWENEFHSYVPPDVVIDSSQPSQSGDEYVREVLTQFSGKDTQGYTRFRYDRNGRLIQTYTYARKDTGGGGGQNTYTTVNNYYDDDGTMIATDTFTQSMGTEGQSASKSRDEKHYITLPNGEKFLSQEFTSRYQNDSGLSITNNDLVDSRVTVHHPSRVGQSHVVTVSMDGEVVGEAGGQNTGDDRVTPFRNKKAADFANSFDTSTGEWKTTTQETGMTVHGLSLYDSSFPIHDEATLIKVTNALRNLNRKTKETVNVILYNFEHLIDFNDKIILNGATYFLASNTARTTPRIKFEQNLSLVRWY